MEEEEDMSQPFWLQNGHADRRIRRHLRRSYSLFLSSTALLVLLLVTAFVFIFIVVPTLRSFTSQIFKPHLVKKSWDSLNLVLVLFAIVCGFLGRNTNNETPRSYEDQSFSNASQDYANSNPVTSRPWHEYSDRTASFNRLRSFNSYPDLRQESLWVAADERWRFYDDTHVSGYRGLDFDEHQQLRHRRPRPEVEEELGSKDIAVDSSVVRSDEVPNAPPQPQPQPASSPPPLPSSPPPATRTKAVRRNAKRTYQAIAQAEMTENIEQVEVIEKGESNDLGTDGLEPRPSTPPPPPPRPPSPPPLLMERKTAQSKKKRGIATKEFLTSLRGKKKKQRQRSVENFESIINSEPFHLASQPPSSSAPPPPPPTPSVFHNLFSSKKNKHKKRHHLPSPPPQISSVPLSKIHKPPLSNKREHPYSLEDNVVTGNESPLIPIPPPPPPPPLFKVPAWKFRVRGDFVRIDSMSSSSRSGSPDLDEVVESPTNQASQQCNSLSVLDDGEAAISLFCPSPDVDTEADTFIERFRAGLRMEKMNSMKDKRGIGRSNLGPETREETRPS